MEHLRSFASWDDGPVPVPHLVGRAPAFLGALARLQEIAEHDAAVLIRGETGTGKELVARALHARGPRASRPYRAVNLGAVPDSLIEDELCGHERGAYTDATSRRPGIIRQTEGGTLLLDEVDSLTPRAQIALLRVIEDPQYRALGSGAVCPSNVRWLAASNAPLGRLVDGEVLRRDLYFRLAALVIDLPPLRDRAEDIPLLATHFVAKHAREREPRLLPKAIAYLMDQPWPGNVRELENAIKSALLVAQDAIEPEHFTSRAVASQAPSYQTLKRQALERFDRDFLRQVMMEHRGNITQAARAAGLHRRELQRLLHRYGEGAGDLPHPCGDFPAPPSEGAFPRENAAVTPDGGAGIFPHPPAEPGSQPHETTDPAGSARDLRTESPDSECS